MPPEIIGKIYSCPTTDIIVPVERVRKDFNTKELAKLAESLKSKGHLQPGVCIETEEGYELLAGERRLRACELAQIPYHFVLREQADEATLLEIELEENVCRADLTYQEEAAGIEKLHRLLQEKANKGVAGKKIHGVRETAAYLNKSAATISDDLMIAKFLDVKEVREAKNKSEAKKVIKRMADQYERAQKFKQATAKELEEEGDSSELNHDDLALLQARTYAKKIIYGTFEDLVPKLEKSPDIVIFDPPWGEDLDKVSSKSGSKKNYKDGKEEFLKLKERLEMLYAKMQKNSHLYLFFGIRRHQEVYDLLDAVGFSTNRIPIFWHKIGAHRTRNPDQWPGRSYEVIAFARKGNKILVRKGAPDTITARPAFGKSAGHHRSPKNPEVYRDLLLRSALPGEFVLDPMCGTGPLGVAAEAMDVTHKLDWLMIDKDKSFTDLALQNVLRGYADITLGRDIEGE